MTTDRTARLIEAFVAGVEWWQDTARHNHLFVSERVQAEAEAVKRYGEPAAPEAERPRTPPEHDEACATLDGDACDCKRPAAPASVGGLVERLLTQAFVAGQMDAQKQKAGVAESFHRLAKDTYRLARNTADELLALVPPTPETPGGEQ